MGKIVIIEDEYGDKGRIAEICMNWPDDLEIYSAVDEKRALRYIREKEIDLILCDLSSGYGPQLKNLSNLAYRYPYIPCLAIIDKKQHIEKEALNNGATQCLFAPVNKAELRLRIHKLLEDANSGSMRNIPVHSLLQMFEGDEKTCSLRVSSDDRVGMIYMENGKPISAETEDHVNEDAMYSIITWEDAMVEIKHYNGQRPHEIQQSLLALIMEAFRLKDERDSLEEKQQAENKPRLELKHLSTTGNRISLEVGAKIKMELDSIDTPLVSTMVGMAANEYLIVTTPRPYENVKEAINSGNKIIVKYLHMGRLCMFKTDLLADIQAPQALLFLEYPSIIHFHELRKAKRTNIFVPCTIRHDGGVELSGVLVDLSFMGCLFLAKVRGNEKTINFDIDSEVELNCLLPGVDEKQVLSGLVKNFKKSTTETRIGIEFDGVADHLKDAIENYVESIESMSR